MFICLNQICLPSYKFTEIVIVRHIDIRSTCRSLLRNIKFNRYTFFISKKDSCHSIQLPPLTVFVLVFLALFTNCSATLEPVSETLFFKMAMSSAKFGATVGAPKTRTEHMDNIDPKITKKQEVSISLKTRRRKC